MRDFDRIYAEVIAHERDHGTVTAVVLPSPPSLPLTYIFHSDTWLDAPVAPTFFGYPVEIDLSLPNDEIRIKSGEQVIRIVNLAKEDERS